MRFRRMLLGVAVLLVLTGCGDDSGASLDDDKEQKAAQALSVEFQGQNPSDFERDVGLCMGKRLVNEVGTEELVAGGLLNDDLTVNRHRDGIKDPDLADGYARAVLACQDVRGEIESRRGNYPEATDADIDEYVTCVEGIDDALLKNSVVAGAMLTQDPATRTYAAKTRACAEALGPRKK